MRAAMAVEQRTVTGRRAWLRTMRRVYVTAAARKGTRVVLQKQKKTTAAVPVEVAVRAAVAVTAVKMVDWRIIVI